MNVPSSPGRQVTRRALFASVGVGALAAVAGCNPFSSAPQTITVTEAPTSTPTPGAPSNSPTVLLGLIFTTRLHVDHLTTAVAEDKRDAALFATLLADRQTHLTALTDEYTRQFGAAPAGGSTPAPSTATGTSSAAADPDEVIGQIRGDATDAQSKFTDALSSASRHQAQLFGSIAACIATHRMVLS